MRLELNLPALERLLGGDTEIEVHLRHQIVEEFSRKHLKALLNDETWRRVSKVWKEELDLLIDSKLKELVGSRETSADNARIEQTIRWRIDDMVKKAAQAAVDEAIGKVIEYQKRYFAADIQKAVKTAMERDVNRAVEDEIQRRLTAAKEVK